MRKRLLRLVALLSLGLPLCGGAAAMDMEASAATAFVREPYRLVRSLRMLQDQVVAGKPEAVVMLNRLLGYIGADLGRTPPEVWEKPENIYAAIVYLFNGGNPEAVRKVLADLKADAAPKELIDGALAYASGGSVDVVRLFSAPLPPDVPAELRASLVLVTASRMTAFDPAMALARLDAVRLESPGTLFEEAAIRRSLPIAARLGDADKVRMLARNYMQRFPRSPYMRDFMAQFVDAALKLNDRIGNAELAKLIATADPLMQYSLYLQIARGALLNGQTARAKFMSSEAQKLAGGLKVDPSRAKLYAAASDVVTDAAGDAMAELSRIAPDRLQERDRQLLKAAEAVGTVVTRAPKADENRQSQPDQNAMQPEKDTPIGNGLPLATDDDVQKTMEEARRKLAEIDALLGKTVR